MCNSVQQCIQVAMAEKDDSRALVDTTHALAETASTSAGHLRVPISANNRFTIQHKKTGPFLRRLSRSSTLNERKCA